ncbi:hypothetical protein [Dokdonia sp.]|uniref:hypothetical protein n=1 Tax=Dokdonia sp. TaxID=2024995 RepID=UPI0032661962
MGNRKDIGKLFNERFKDFEQAPDANLWNNIASELDQESDRKIAPFWFYFGGLVLVGMLAGLWFWQPWNTTSELPSLQEQQTIVNNDTLENNTSKEGTTTDALENTNTQETLSSNNTTGTKTTITTQSSITNNEDHNTTNNTTLINNSSNTSDSSLNVQNSDQTQPTIATNNSSSKTQSTSNSYTNNTSLSNTTSQTSSQVYTNQKTASILEVLRTMESATQKARKQKELEARETYQTKIKNELAQAITLQKEESKIASQKWFDSIANLEAIKKAELAVKTVETAKEEKLPKLPKTKEEREKDRKESVDYKLAISPYTSILSYGSLTKGSSIDDRLVNNPRDAIGTIGYGIRADYKLSERSSVRFGIGLAPLQYRTSDFQVLITGDNNINIFQLSGINPQNLGQGQGGGIETSPQALSFFNMNDVVSIEQDISYIEVPIDYQYRLLNKRVSVSFNTGLSLFVLTNNEVFATAESGQSIFIGRETSLKDLSLAFNLGLGTHYNFSKKWRFDIEPAFKYQLNPYSDNIGNFKPYYFGLQFGMSYKF